MSHKIPYSISPIAAAVSTALAAPGAVLAQEDGASDVLDEIIVTATKRELNLQKVPASVQALPEAMLKDMGAMNTQDYTRFMPSVNWISTNAGNNQIIFRGVHTSTGAFTMTRSSSVYLDEIPITSTAGDSPDVRMLDVARVEALSGPQGTLFGGAAQAGILRIITNKPDTSRFEASADVQFSSGEHSDPSHSITGVFNLPLVEDVFAIRIAAQSAKDGGYIDNMLGNTPDTWYGETNVESAAGSADCTAVAPTTRAWGCNRLEAGNHLNTDVAEENWNSADHVNLRISALWEINEEWAITAAYNYGNTDSQGNSTYNPFVGDLQTIGFLKNRSESDWQMASLTIDADLGFAQFVSATSFYENQRTYVADNTLYYHYYMSGGYCTDQGVHADVGYYWFWENTANGRAIYNPRYCSLFPAVNPSGDVTQLPAFVGVGKGPEWQERFTQEFRLSHQGDSFDWLAGLYYEQSNDSWNSVWMASPTVPYQDSISYAAIQDCFETGGNNGASYNWGCNTGSNAVNSADPAVVAASLLTADHLWDSRDDTDWETTAVFGEVTWHANDQTNVTVGGRWFENTNDKLYTKWILGNAGKDSRQEGGYLQPLWVGNDIVQTQTLSEFVPKISIDYNFGQDSNKMAYATYSQGYRVGGINRANRNARWDRTLWGQVWDPDKLHNYEFGLKSRWADNTVQLNVVFFYMDWEQFQHEVVDPSVGECVIAAEEPTCRPAAGTDRSQADQDTYDVSADKAEALPWISIVGNVGDAHATGLDVAVDWIPSDRWVLGANAQFLEREIDATDAPPQAGIVPGMELPNTPTFQGSLWGTYTWPVQIVQGAEMFIRAQYSYTGESLSKLVPDGMDSPSPQFVNPSYAIADLRFGLLSGDGDWQVDLFVTNVTDERAQVNVSNSVGEYQWGRTGQYEHATNVVTVRPREYGFRFTTRWGD